MFDVDVDIDVDVDVDVDVVRGISLASPSASHPDRPATGSAIRGQPIDVVDRRAASGHSVPGSAVATFAQAAYVDLAKSNDFERDSLDGTHFAAFA
jgi:hypothetical protein